ncbi:hypothetical protein RHSIM_RhsimUnG0151500 [Rhododendron simsii]|uniref:Uncharacterized protein n=1 Tax=Rhododendron simsii TaxID=118357 RepID=A0A834FVK2_RHOSS|nr:hypothetical protein RHSIM_RhsimUnG0151500 [Rhododendron simsii]
MDIKFHPMHQGNHNFPPHRSRIVSSSKQFSSPGPEGSAPREEDDDVGISSGDKDTNRAGENESGEGNNATKRNKGADSHIKKGNQVTAAQGKEDQQSIVQKSAEILNQVVVEENNNEESSHSTQGLESFVQDSIVSDTEDEHISPTNKAQECEAQVIECAEVVSQQQAIERNALTLNSPEVIDSNIRASQIQGINIEVNLQPRDTKKASRKARRRNLYEGSLSLSDKEYYEEYVSDSDLEGQEQDMTSDELRTTIALGNTLEIDFAKSDILKMKNMIEMEAKEYFLIQRNNNPYSNLFR